MSTGIHDEGSEPYNPQTIAQLRHSAEFTLKGAQGLLRSVRSKMCLSQEETVDLMDAVFAIEDVLESIEANRNQYRKSPSNKEIKPNANE